MNTPVFRREQAMRERTANPITWRGRYAGFVSRLVAMFIDILILSVVLAVTTLLYNVVIKNLINLSRLVFGRELIQPTAQGGIIISILIVFLVFGFYFIFQWVLLGSTIGGLILGIRIVNRSGRYPTLWQALVRYLAEFFFPLVGIIESLWILFDRQRQALFDMIAGTYVIYNWDARPDETFLAHETSEVMGSQAGKDKQA